MIGCQLAAPSQNRDERNKRGGPGSCDCLVWGQKEPDQFPEQIDQSSEKRRSQQSARRRVRKINGAIEIPRSPAPSIAMKLGNMRSLRQKAALPDPVWPCWRILGGRGARSRRRLPNGRRIGSLWHFQTPVWWILHGSLPRSCQWLLGGARLRSRLSQEHVLISHLEKLATKKQGPGSEALRSSGPDDPPFLKRDGRGLKMTSRSRPRMFPNRCEMKEIAGVIPASTAVLGVG